MPFIETLTTCISAHWDPAIGDPTPLGWASVAAYGIAALMVFRVGFGLRGLQRGLWLASALLLLVLMVNKQLDLQTLLFQSARCHALELGWYQDRQEVQRQLLFGLGVLFLFVAVGLLLIVWRSRADLPICLAIALTGFLLLAQSARLSRVSTILKDELGPIVKHPGFEFIAVGLFILAAVLRARRNNGFANQKREHER